jgi:hypothetical protein
MARKPQKRLCKQPPRYHFALNEYQTVRFSKCPQCRKLTFNRKFPLLIHVERWGLIILGKTCRYCSQCELIIAHEAELVHEIDLFYQEHCPHLKRSGYFAVGTVERKTWKKGLLSEPGKIGDVLEKAADFKGYVKLYVDPGGWRPANP